MLNVDNQNRARAKLVIGLSPGIHLRSLQRALGVSFTTARYHVRNLERDGEITSSEAGRYCRLFPAGTTEEMKRTYEALQDGSTRRVLSALVGGSGDLTNGELCRRAGLSAATVGECLKALVGSGLARRYCSPDGRVLFGALETERIRPILSSFEKNMLDIASDRFIDLWDV